MPEMQRPTRRVARAERVARRARAWDPAWSGGNEQRGRPGRSEPSCPEPAKDPPPSRRSNSRASAVRRVDGMRALEARISAMELQLRQLSDKVSQIAQSGNYMRRGGSAKSTRPSNAICGLCMTSGRRRARRASDGVRRGLTGRWARQVDGRGDDARARREGARRRRDRARRGAARNGGYSAIVQTFGTKVLGEDKEIDRSKLAAEVFGIRRSFAAWSRSSTRA